MKHEGTGLWDLSFARKMHYCIDLLRDRIQQLNLELILGTSRMDLYNHCGKDKNIFSLALFSGLQTSNFFRISVRTSRYFFRSALSAETHESACKHQFNSVRIKMESTNDNEPRWKDWIVSSTRAKNGKRWAKSFKPPSLRVAFPPLWAPLGLPARAPRGAGDQFVLPKKKSSILQYGVVGCRCLQPSPKSRDKWCHMPLLPLSLEVPGANVTHHDTPWHRVTHYINIHWLLRELLLPAPVAASCEPSSYLPLSSQAKPPAEQVVELSAPPLPQAILSAPAKLNSINKYKQ